MKQTLSYETRADQPSRGLPHFGIASLALITATGGLFFALERGLNGRPAGWMLLLLPAMGVTCGMMGVCNDPKKRVAWIGLICNAVALMGFGAVFAVVWSIGPLPDL
jgi:hypothetical protein